MTTELPQDNALDPSFVRVQLDEILAAEITSLIEIDSDSALLSYNLATISCIVIAVEREREMKVFSDSLPERFTKSTFMDELAEIGLDNEEEVKKAIDAVIEQSYISVTPANELKAGVSAYTMVGFLDNMFPGMQGMNLIAFVMQMNDEVNSGRKSLEEAKQSFAQTLKSRGVAVTKAKAQEKASEIASGKAFNSQAKQLSKKLKEANVKRTARLRFKRKDAKPSFYSRDGFVSEVATVKNLFDKGPSREELAAQQAARAAAEQEAIEILARAEELKKREEKIKAVEEAARIAEERVKALEAREEELKAARELRQREAEMAAKEAELKALEAQLKSGGVAALESEPTDAYKSEETDDLDDIESRIAAFEAELAMPCPLCKDGSIVSETTQTNKDYYTCSNSNCRFVSWDKPYHFSCPLCKNSYLTEFQTPSGEKGLKCPRASCSYTQNKLADPAQTAASAVSNKIPMKKRKVVRRVKKRR